MIDAIRQKISQGQFEFTQHAVDETIRRRISVGELRQALGTGEVIEDYPDDKYGPSRLILGYNHRGRPLHVH